MKQLLDKTDLQTKQNKAEICSLLLNIEILYYIVLLLYVTATT